MNKSDIVGRVADRMRLSKSAAEGAVDTVLEAIAEALAKEEAVRNVCDEEPQCPHRPKPSHRRTGGDSGLEGAVVQGGQGTQGRCEQGLGTDARRSGG